MVVLEKILRFPWTGRRSNQLTDAEAPILCPPDSMIQLIGKITCCQKLKANGLKAENEMVRYHQQLNGHKFEQFLGDSGGQRSLVCCSPWGHKESDMT